MAQIHHGRICADIIKDEFMFFAGTWMKLETIILSKLTQEQKTKYHILTYQWELNNENIWAQGREHHTPGPVWGLWAERRELKGWDNRCNKLPCHTHTYVTNMHVLHMYLFFRRNKEEK